MWSQNARAFNVFCSLCHGERDSVYAQPNEKAKSLGFKFVNYRVCTWCDRANFGKRK